MGEKMRAAVLKVSIEPLECVNDVFQRMEEGKISRRVVLRL